MYKHVADAYISRADELLIPHRVDADLDTVYFGEGTGFRMVHYKDSSFAVRARIPALENGRIIPTEIIIAFGPIYEALNPAIQQCIFDAYWLWSGLRRKEAAFLSDLQKYSKDMKSVLQKSIFYEPRKAPTA